MTRTTRRWAVAAATLAALPLLVAVDCGSDEPARDRGVVKARYPRNGGVDLLVEFPDGKKVTESYRSSTWPHCTVGAEWPRCTEL